MSRERPSSNGATTNDFPTSPEELDQMEDFDEPENAVGSKDNSESTRIYSPERGKEKIADGGTRSMGSERAQPDLETDAGMTTGVNRRSRYDWENLSRDLQAAYQDDQREDFLEGEFNAADIVEILKGRTRRPQVPQPRFPVEHAEEVYSVIEDMLGVVGMKTEIVSGASLKDEYGNEKHHHAYREAKQDAGEFALWYSINQEEIQ